MGKLYIGAADDLDGVYDAVSLLLQPFLQLLGDRKHGGGAEGIAGVRAQRVNIFDKADRDHVSLCVAHDFQL